MTKVFVVLNAVLSVVVSVMFIATAATWSDYKGQVDDYRLKYQAALAERDSAFATLQAESARTGEVLRGKADEIRKIQEELAARTAATEELQTEVVRQQNKAETATAAQTKLQATVDLLTPQLVEQQNRNSVLLNEKLQLQTENTELSNQILDLSANRTILTEQVRNLQERLYIAERQVAELEQRIGQGAGAAPAVAQKVAAPTVSGPIRGEIVEVADEYATVNIGETSGVVEGMVLMVYRDGDFLGELEIRSVLPDEAGGRLRMVQAAIQQGDRVSYQKS